MFLARKITRAKWNVPHDLSPGEIPADAVSIDLKTQANSLSFWQCPSDGDISIGVEEAALAIAAARDRVEKLDIVWLDGKELLSDGQTLVDTKGSTPVTDLTSLHVDVSRLDYVRLGKIAHRIVAAIDAKRYLRLRKAEVRRLIEEAVQQGRINPGALKDKLREEVARSG